ncbi:GPW/gp25 family protein [Thiococcus pfennigii]|uniref:GPW/gp25 family protein n=1 Tax=Thiococcus pfennigii TaxID=1057 RepID=UPI001907B962|nr:GPW/gp25 family protein [Thiococcus pfennigii]MBK1699381.1 baseplate protein [Thiococcus pfennigii]
MPMQPPSKNAFVGQGWGFPIHLDADGDIALAAQEENVRQAIRLILGTSPGERLMRPDFGSGLRALAFEPLSSATVAMARLRVEQALIRWEPRIDQIAVQVETDPQQGRLLIEIRYRLRSTNTFYNLVYPFYLQEARVSP